MSLAVVRCPACGGASRVPEEAIGQMVGCPRCQTPFVAADDAPAPPLPSRATTRPPRARPVDAPVPRPVAVIPIAPPREPQRTPPQAELSELPSMSGPVLATEVPDPEHDPHTPPIGGLPVSVLVGFALMPFGIPLLWFVGPLITRTEAVLSLAVPVSLAVAAAALCLGVVYTIDWTAATRIKGVLILVGLSYLTAAGLYFLKKDLMDRVQGFFGRSNDWAWVQSEDRSCRVKMPGRAWPDKHQPPLPDVVPMADVRRAYHITEAQREQTYEYQFAVSKPKPLARRVGGGWLARVREETWFACIGERLKGAGGKLVAVEPKTHAQAPGANGRQWTFELEDGRTVRIVRVFVAADRVYYLSAEGPRLTPDDEEHARPFFESFEMLAPPVK